MSAEYKGLHVRSFPGDTNKYPKPVNSKVWQSPDIIPWGENVCLDPVKEFLGSNFNTQYDNKVILGVKNYLYVRGENKSGKQLSGQIYLYQSDSTMLLTPSTWVQINNTQDENKGYVQFDAKPGEKIVCTSGDDGIFAFTPAKTKDHPCFISRVVTKDHPAPIPVLDNITDFSIFLRSDQSMGYSQHNSRYIDAAAPNHSITEKIYNEFRHDITDGLISLTLRCVPKGSEIHMTCPGSRQGCYLEIPKRVITEDTFVNPLVLSCKIDNMPTGFSHPLHVNYWSNGNKSDSRFQIEIDMLTIADEQSRAYSYGSPLTLFGINELHTENEGVLTGDGVIRNLESIKPKTAIRVGSCSYTAKA